MVDVEYLYCIGDTKEDFITTSFSYDENYINIYNFNKNFNIEKIEYVAIDYAADVFLSFKEYKYTNTQAIKYYKVLFIERDIDRMTVLIKIINSIDKINLLLYKRDIFIEKIIN